MDHFTFKIPEHKQEGIQIYYSGKDKGNMIINTITFLTKPYCNGNKSSKTYLIRSNLK